MPRQTIGNPVSWSAQRLVGVAHAFEDGINGIGSHEMQRPDINRIGMADIRYALRKGIEDFAALRSDVIFLVLLYPVIGFVLAYWAFHAGQVHLMFPLIAGFPLVGPLAAIGLYEMSRQREQGQTVSWGATLDALKGRVVGPELVMGLLLAVIFALWLYAAHLIWAATLGPEPAASLADFLRQTFSTDAGWTMIWVGLGVGFLFAVVVLCLSLISIPMLIARPVGVPVAIATSLAVVRENPAAAVIWGLIVAMALLIGSLPVFVGLVIVFPVLGHATWHLYRRAVSWPDRA